MGGPSESVLPGVHGWPCITRRAWVAVYYPACMGGRILPGMHGWPCITRRAWVAVYVSLGDYLTDYLRIHRLLQISNTLKIRSSPDMRMFRDERAVASRHVSVVRATCRLPELSGILYDHYIQEQSQTTCTHTYLTPLHDHHHTRRQDLTRSLGCKSVIYFASHEIIMRKWGYIRLQYNDARIYDLAIAACPVHYTYVFHGWSFVGVVVFPKLL
jgi:hypothetical protein